MAWEIVLTREVEEWFLALSETDPQAADSVEDIIGVLEAEGPTLGRPLVDRITGSRLHNLKELRPPSTSIRILFLFDPERNAVLLTAGDKQGQWKSWYAENIPLAEVRYERWRETEGNAS